jgi:thiosulfate/3-mercaptopyruvate sulfurtransferase
MNTPVISAAQLKQQLSSNTVVLDCRFSLTDESLGEQQYRQGHIPGAYYISLNDHLSSPRGEYGGRHPLPDSELFSEVLRGTGICTTSQVVVYDDSRMGFAARAWWLIRYYLGHENVAILNGGYSAWINANYPVDRRQPPLRQGNFTASLNKQWIVDAGQVKNMLETHCATLIDSREQKRYRGEEEPIDPIAGHIPGALNYPWQSVTDEKGFVLDSQAQQARWRDLPNDQELVVYCGSGVTACVNLLSLTLAGRNAKLYPGSWSDWCCYDSLPKSTML